MDKSDSMRIVIGADHGGYDLKEGLKQFLLMKGYSFQDVGTFSKDPVDYPDFAVLVAQLVARKEFDLGILICTTGVGVSIVANKVPGVRAALCHDCFQAELSRQHNHANVLCLGGKIIGIRLAEKIVEVWLSTQESSEERHLRRLAKVDLLDKERAVGKERS